MRLVLLALVLSVGAAPLAGAQQTAVPKAGHTKHAVSAASGKARHTPRTSPIPGSSTTGNATGPAGTAPAPDQSAGQTQ